MMTKSELKKKIITEPYKLTPNQEDAVCSECTHIRIIAGAGAGKTETLTRKIVYLLLLDEVPPSSIVAFTFTDKAAESMKSRVYQRVHAIGGDNACAKLGEMYVGTIHGYAARLLEESFGYGGYSVLDENQVNALLLGRIGRELGFMGSGRIGRCKQFLETVAVVHNELISYKTLAKQAPEFHQNLLAYENKLDTLKRLTFDRMIRLSVENLEQNPTATEHVDYLIVDEYQDINRAQERLIHLVGKTSKILIVGDPRQTIYQWRGSDEKCFEDFAHIYQEVKTIPISENKRSAESIIKVANSISASFNKASYEKLSHDKKRGRGVAYMLTHDRDVDEAEWITSQIKTLIDSESCSYSDIGILLRSVNTSAPAFIDVFRERGIPFIIGGKVGLFRRGEALAVGMLFAWLHEKGFWNTNPYNWNEKIEGDDIVKTALLNWRDAVNSISLPRNIEKKLIAWKEDVLSGQFNNFTEAFYELLVLLKYLELDPSNPNQAVIMANLGRISTLLTDYETATLLGGQKRRWTSNVNGLCWYLNSYASSSYEEQAGDDIRGVEAVQLMTVHQAKGLEWPVVFIPAMTNQRFPSSKTGKVKTWDIPKDQGLFDCQRYEGSIEDERRLFYVAATRARDTLVISNFQRLKNAASPSILLDTIPASILSELPSSGLISVPTLEIQGITEEIQSFYAGELIAYKKCPHFYRLREIWGYQPGLVQMLGYGSSLHHCLRCAAELIQNEGYSPISAVMSAVEQHFFLPFAPQVIVESAKLGAQKTLVNFAKEHEDDMRRIKEVEARIEFPIQKATLSGKVDVILHDDESYEVRDYKTSDTMTTNEEASLQIQLYSIGLEMLGLNISKGSLSFLEEARTEQVVVDETTLAKARELAEGFISGIMNKEFSPCPGKFCEQCDYSPICRWRK